jgi:diadenylate cyclase
MSEIITNYATLSNLWFVARLIIQVGLLASLIYTALVFMRGTRAAPVLLGLVIVTIVGWFLANLLGLEVFEYLLSQVPQLLAFALIIIFQPELRRAFAEIGANPHRLFSPSENLEQTIDAIVEASYKLAEQKLGALVAIECKIGMRAYSETGVALNAQVSAELLRTIFYKNTPLHDGAVIIKDGMVVAANCYFPLTQGDLRRQFGTRHRAGVGVTEETDAIVVIVSEETGAVSVAHSGRLTFDVERQRLRRHLSNYLTKRSRQGALLQTGLRVRLFFEGMRNVLGRAPAPPVIRPDTDDDLDDDESATTTPPAPSAPKAPEAATVDPPAPVKPADPPVVDPTAPPPDAKTKPAPPTDPTAPSEGPKS